MRIFVTGASGFIGSAVVPELLGAGHQVVGLARSDASAQALAAAGADVHRGSLEDPAGLAEAAAAADGVIHLAYIHDFSDIGASVGADEAAIAAMGEALAGSDRPLVIASGVLGLATGRPGTESDRPAAGVAGGHRVPAAEATLALAGRGVRSCVLRLPPSVHDAGDQGFISTVIGVAREREASGYPGDGANRWPAVHRRDAARLFRLAVEAAPAGSVLHAVGDEGVPTRTIAETIGRGLGLPVTAVAADQVAEHFGWIGPFFAIDGPATSALTRELLDWRPSHQGLLADIEEHYLSA